MSRPFSNESVFRAVAHPTRRRILDLLRHAERSVSEIASSLGISMNNLSPHLGVLRTSGLVVQRRRGHFRFYALAPQNLKPIAAWMRAYESVLARTRK
jgi:DNA-binding transcriptional ArsR family regulator